MTALTASREATVRIDGTDRVFPIAAGEDLLEVLGAHGEPIPTACGGVATCGTCLVVVVAGGDALVGPRSRELEHLGETARAGFRLACQARLRKDLASNDGRRIVVAIPSATRSPP